MTAIPTSLFTPRLHLRPWRAEDLAPFATLNADPEVMRHFPTTLDRAASDALAQRCNDLIAAQGWGFWAAALRANGAFIGFIGLHRPAAHLPCSPCIEVGWRLARPYWGSGLATEGARAAADFAFGTLAVDEVVAFTTLDNHRSEAVMQRLGMRRDATPFAHPDLPDGHPLQMHVLYRLRRPGP